VKKLNRGSMMENGGSIIHRHSLFSILHSQSMAVLHVKSIARQCASTRLAARLDLIRDRVV